jgi:hypothetical protein
VRLPYVSDTTAASDTSSTTGLRFSVEGRAWRRRAELGHDAEGK